MWWTTLKLLVFGMALTMLGGNLSKAAPAPRNEDMFRELMKLDQLYSSIARPRFGKRGEHGEVQTRSKMSSDEYDTNRIQYRGDQDESARDWLPLKRR